MILAHRQGGQNSDETRLGSGWMRLIKEKTRDYRFTVAFLVISGLVFLTAAHVISVFAGRSAEANAVRMIQAQSERDALIFARLVSQAISGAESPDSGRLAAELFKTSDVMRISLVDAPGGEVWSFGEAGWEGSESGDAGMASAFNGQATTVLLQSPGPADSMDRPAIDVVESFIPLVDEASGKAMFVLSIARNVTEDLQAEIAVTRSELFRSVFSVMAVGFGALFVMVAAIDITLKRSRRRNMGQQLSLARLSIENQELERANLERNRFVAMVSHELRNPLTSILTFTDLLEHRLGKLDSKRDEEFLDSIRRSGIQLDRLITDLLETAKFHAGHLNIEPIEFKPAEMLDEAVELNRPLLEGKRQRLHRDFDLPAGAIHADRGRLVQVASNLLTNASKYTPKGSVITLKASMMGNVLAVSVLDNGPGIPRHAVPNVFDPFYRVDGASTPAEKGTGLGLAIVKAIVEAHGGAVELRSELGQGTEVTFRVPVGTKRRPAPALPANAETTAPALPMPAKVIEAEESRDLVLRRGG